MPLRSLGGPARGHGDQRGGVPEPRDADEADQGVRLDDAPEGYHGRDGDRMRVERS